jgi:hypothetical protein
MLAWISLFIVQQADDMKAVKRFIASWESGDYFIDTNDYNWSEKSKLIRMYFPKSRATDYIDMCPQGNLESAISRVGGQSRKKNLYVTYTITQYTTQIALMHSLGNDLS